MSKPNTVVLFRKTVKCELEILTTMTDYGVSELIEQTLMNSSLNNSEFCLKINETKVIDSKPATR